MVRVVLLGGGNLAEHLAIAFHNSSKIELLQIYNRTLDHIIDKKRYAPITDSIDLLVAADIYIIATSDASIEKISRQIQSCSGLVVHTSGATDMNTLQNYRRGVLYPLQSFSKGSKVDFSQTPFCIESNHQEDLLLLESLADAISKKVYKMDSDQRKKLHIAAVFVNNFVNHLYQIGEEICLENKIPFEVLQPIIEETAAKIKNKSPKETQTGPASRKDFNTLALHKKELNSSQQKIYQLLSEAIINT